MKPKVPLKILCFSVTRTKKEMLQVQFPNQTRSTYIWWMLVVLISMAKFLMINACIKNKCQLTGIWLSCQLFGYFYSCLLYWKVHLIFYISTQKFFLVADSAKLLNSTKYNKRMWLWQNLKTEAPMVPRASFTRWLLSPRVTYKSAAY